MLSFVNIYLQICLIMLNSTMLFRSSPVPWSIQRLKFGPAGVSAEGKQKEQPKWPQTILTVQERGQASDPHCDSLSLQSWMKLQNEVEDSVSPRRYLYKKIAARATRLPRDLLARLATCSQEVGAILTMCIGPLQRYKSRTALPSVPRSCSQSLCADSGIPYGRSHCLFVKDG